MLAFFAKFLHSSHPSWPLQLHHQQRAHTSIRPNGSDNFFLGSRENAAARTLLVFLLHPSSSGTFSCVCCFLLLVLQWAPWLSWTDVLSSHWRQRLTKKLEQNRTTQCEMKLLSGATGICDPQDSLVWGDYFHATSQNWFLSSPLTAKSYFLLHCSPAKSIAES